VRRRSPAAVAGLYAGDRIVAINGTPLRDAIDFQFYAADDRLRLTVERDRKAHDLIYGSRICVFEDQRRVGLTTDVA